jgi:hypothetical protein
MGVPVPEMNPADDGSAEALLGSLRTISAPERRKHASIYNYWLSIKGDREFPPIRDLDPLEISDAGPYSLLLEMIGGGEDADIRHVGHAIKNGIDVAKVGEAPNPSLLSSVARRLPVVAACRDAFAFEDSFETVGGRTRFWVTLLPFSATGTWIDYVYGFVSLDGGAATAAPEVHEDAEPASNLTDAVEEASGEPVESKPVESQPEPEVEEQPERETAAEVAKSEPLDLVPEPADEQEQTEPVEIAPEPAAEIAEPAAADEPEETLEPLDLEAPVEQAKPTLSAKFMETVARAGFYGRPVEIELDLETAKLETREAEESPPPPEAEAEPEPEPEPEPEESVQPQTPEGTLQSKLAEVRTKADEARQAKLRANAALYEGLAAAYDFALDAEEAPEEYLKLVEQQGLKIQLRSPMAPVVRLAFDGMCDDSTIAQLETVLAWALKSDLPRGSLAERIESEGGIAPILNGRAKAA